MRFEKRTNEKHEGMHESLELASSKRLQNPKHFHLTSCENENKIHTKM